MLTQDTECLTPEMAGWSAEQELIFATIQQVESVPRAEARRRRQQREKAFGS